ncbi:MAG TPA: 4'-phosphopantetheinyl transferase superfamily protein [Thermoanaerobaculia bacterium]
MIRLAVPPQWQKKACVVRDVAPRDLDAYFTEAERERVASFKREKRRAEWAASRLAAKLLAVENALCDDPRACSVDSAYRRPSLAIDGARTDREITITHSEGAGGAALGARRVGLDLQKVRPLAERATKFFLNDDEVAAWRAVRISDALIHFWCAKEAGYKIHAGRGWYRGVHIEPAGETPGGLRFTYRDGASRGTIETARLDDDFVLALAEMMM